MSALIGLAVIVFQQGLAAGPRRVLDAGLGARLHPGRCLPRAGLPWCCCAATVAIGARVPHSGHGVGCEIPVAGSITSQKLGQWTPVVVLGATGGVGRGVVAAALAAGRPVIAVARDKAGAAAPAGRTTPSADLSVVAGSVSQRRATARRWPRRLRELGRPLGGVMVAVCGSAGRGRLLDQPAAYLRQRARRGPAAAPGAARHLLPLLAEADRGGSYVLIGGPGAEQPWAGYGHRSIAAAALRMLARVLHEEARAHRRARAVAVGRQPGAAPSQPRPRLPAMAERDRRRPARAGAGRTARHAERHSGGALRRRAVDRRCDSFDADSTTSQ